MQPTRSLESNMRRNRLVLLLPFLAVACAEPGPSAPDEAAFSRISTGNGGALLYALTADNTILTLDAAQPSKVIAEVSVSGLMAGETLSGIDFRPSDLTADGIDRIGALYAVSNQSRLYIVDPATGVAGTPVAIQTPVGGSVVGFGFNPAADRVRIHGSDNQNLRINPDNGVTLVDGTLAYAAGDANDGATPAIAALGYTNSDADPATGTALYAIDHSLDVLAVLNANLGILTTVGPLGIDASMAGGFDIVGSMNGTAYAILTDSPSGKPTLYTIDLTSGGATKVGLMAQTKAAIVSLAVSP
jgi:hypothetical protein